MGIEILEDTEAYPFLRSFLTKELLKVVAIRQRFTAGGIRVSLRSLMIMKSEHSGNDFLLTSLTRQGIIESNGTADQTAQVTIRPQSLLVCSTGSGVSNEAQRTAHR
jgi:hypothetical protein